MPGHVFERGPIEREDLGFATRALHSLVEALAGFLADESLGEHLLDECGHRERGARVSVRQSLVQVANHMPNDVESREIEGAERDCRTRLRDDPGTPVTAGASPAGVRRGN